MTCARGHAAKMQSAEECKETLCVAVVVHISLLRTRSVPFEAPSQLQADSIVRPCHRTEGGNPVKERVTKP